MTNLPAAMRETLAQSYAIDAPETVQALKSADGTRKYLFRLADGNCIETALMKYRHGNSVCISSQAGCRMGCKFCAQTAQNALAAQRDEAPNLRNLSAGEMAAQVYAVVQDTGEAVNNVVLMGIGEPLDNLDNVADFFHIITAEEGMNLSGRHISLSTCGIVPEIDRLAGMHLPLTLSVSLHAADDATRSALMPVNNKYPLAALLAACARYQTATGRRVTYEYAVIPGNNDTTNDAKQLAALLKKSGAHINLIPVNAVDGGFSAADDDEVRRFRQQLVSLGLNATVRRRLGADINAACGQLRLSQLR